jgi:hypothetical protein
MEVSSDNILTSIPLALVPSRARPEPRRRSEDFALPDLSGSLGPPAGLGQEDEAPGSK